MARCPGADRRLVPSITASDTSPAEPRPAVICAGPEGRTRKARLQPVARALLAGEGFSLIEILVVILIIGVLAAIAIPLFLGQKSKAGDAQAKELGHTAQIAIVSYATDNNGSFEGASQEKLEEIEPSLKPAGAGHASLSKVEATSTTYKLTVTATTGDTFTLARNSSGEAVRTCKQAAGSQGCPNGSW